MLKAAHPAFQRTKPMLHPTPANLALPGVTIQGTYLKIVGKSDAIPEAPDTAYRITSVNTPTLIEGQTGVGKELFARLIHSQIAPGNSRPFTAINCGALTPQSYSDGLPLPIKEWPSAPLFLDETGELPAEM